MGAPRPAASLQRDPGGSDSALTPSSTSPVWSLLQDAMRKAGLTVELVDSPMGNGYGADKVKLFWVRGPQAPTQEGAGKGREGILSVTGV